MAVNVDLSTVICQHCKKPLHWTQRGWVHPRGGLVVVRCEKCRIISDDYAWSHLAFCPNRGGRLVDDHVAMPIQVKR